MSYISAFSNFQYFHEVITLKFFKEFLPFKIVNLLLHSGKNIKKIVNVKDSSKHIVNSFQKVFVKAIKVFQDSRV